MHGSGRIALAAVLAATGAACGAAPSGSVPSAAQTPVVEAVMTPPPGTMAVVSSTSGAPIMSVTPEAVMEPCPRQEYTGGPDQAGLEEAGRLEPMIGMTLAYGNEHPDQFGSYGLIWHDGSDASVFVSFTTDLDAHRSALADAVPYPDELIVCQVALTGSESRALVNSISTEFAGRYLSVGGGYDAVEVMLGPTEEALAAELVERYGAAVRVRVGALAYPIEDAVADCESPPGVVPAPDLTVAVVPTPGLVTVPAGLRQPEMEVRLSNPGDTPVLFQTGGPVASVLDQSGRVVTSERHLPRAGALLSIEVPPGGSTVVPFTVSLASCDPALGYLLPPGEYGVMASLDRIDDNGTTAIVTEPVAFTIAG